MEKISVRTHRPGHPWIFSNQLFASRTDVPGGSVVEVYRGRRFVGCGFYNPHSLIAIRKYSRDREDFTAALVERRIAAADGYRREIMPASSYRMVFSESDGLPGLIIDKFDTGYVLQVNALGMEKHKAYVVDALAARAPSFIYEKDDPYLRTLEGLDAQNSVLSGTLPATVEIIQNDIHFLVDIEHGQKTGFFYDLAGIRQHVKTLAYGRRVLDLCCYSGAFSIYAARGGAASVRGVDISEPALAMAQENARRNQCSTIVFQKADVFLYLEEDRDQYDLIILDPPSFTRSRRKTAEARRGYLKLNLQAMKKLAPGGYLVTTCCSYHIPDHEFLHILVTAGNRAGRTLRIVGHKTQSRDHPILLTMPETHYLKCYILEAVS